MKNEVLFGLMVWDCAAVAAVLCLQYRVYETVVGCLCLTVIALVGAVSLLLMQEARKERKCREK